MSTLAGRDSSGSRPAGICWLSAEPAPAAYRRRVMDDGTRLVSAGMALAVALGAVAACGGRIDDEMSDQPSAAADSRGSSSARPPMSTVPPPTVVQPSEPAKLPTDVALPITLTGELVGDGHSLLVGGQVRWVLLGDIEGHTAGDRVTVSGQPLLVRGPDPMEREEPTLKVTSIRPV